MQHFSVNKTCLFAIAFIHFFKIVKKLQFGVGLEPQLRIALHGITLFFFVFVLQNVPVRSYNNIWFAVSLSLESHSHS